MDNQDLKYATNESTQWKLFTIDAEGDVSHKTSIAVDSKNKVHIAYYDSPNKAIKYVTNAEME